MFPEELPKNAIAEPASEIEPIRFELTDAPEWPGIYHDEPGPRRLWLHILLFVVTLFTTTLAGAHMMYVFHHLPYPEADIGGGNSFRDIFASLFRELAGIFSYGLRSPAAFASGLPFSLTLLAILMAHEMGHYIACVWYRVDATLPFFLPSPVPITGTFGAFIRIRSHIPGKKVLFDIGAAGPLAGFVFLVPALFIGLALSRVMPDANHYTPFQFGVPPLEWLAQKLVFPGVRSADIYLHPVARAAWVGMLATALNLLPGGQLDGGHIIYSLFGRAHKWITLIFVAALVPMGFYWDGWWLWAVLLFFFARRHPPVYDDTAIGAGRILMGALSLVVFLLCFTVSPVAN